MKLQDLFPFPLMPKPIQFKTLYQDHFSEIRRYLERFVAETRAEDLAQEVFIKAGKGLQGFRGEASPRTWLYRIATNTLRDYLRSKGCRDDQAHDGISEHELERYTHSLPVAVSTEQGAIRTEMNDCIREFIRKLPNAYSTILVLSELEGYRNKEIADMLELSLETVKMRLHRARSRLRVELTQGCVFSHSANNELECQRCDNPADGKQNH